MCEAQKKRPAVWAVWQIRPAEVIRLGENEVCPRVQEVHLLKDLRQEIEKRRTFAIISHPDAGKTTLTEKFLLYGGAINLAGSVKGKA